MSFYIQSVSDGHVPPFEYMVCGNITPKAGMALTLSAGKLVTASGTTAPGYISMMEADTAQDDKVIPVLRVEDGITFMTQNSAAFGAVKVGNKVTIANDGLRVTATTTSGVAEVVSICGTDTGSDIAVRFK